MALWLDQKQVIFHFSSLLLLHVNVERPWILNETSFILPLSLYVRGRRLLLFIYLFIFQYRVPRRLPMPCQSVQFIYWWTVGYAKDLFDILFIVVASTSVSYLFHLWQQVPLILEATTFSIKLQKRRFLVLECLNQAPIDGSSGASYGTSGSCSGSSKTGTLDF